VVLGVFCILFSRVLILVDWRVDFVVLGFVLYPTMMVAAAGIAYYTLPTANAV
jgi:hypothetical protein